MLLYETVFVLPADHTPGKIDEFIEKLKAVITSKAGEIALLDKWGRRRLAYPIHRHREGFYVFIQFKAPPAVLAEVTQLFRVSEEVIRYIVCKALKGKPSSPHMAVPAPMHHGAPHGAPHGAAAHAPAPAPTAASPEVPHASPAPSAPAQ